MVLFHLKTYINIYIVKKETGAYFPDFLVSSLNINLKIKGRAGSHLLLFDRGKGVTFVLKCYNFSNKNNNNNNKITL